MPHGGLVVKFYDGAGCSDSFVVGLLEVSFFFAVFHGAVAAFVVGAGAAFGLPGSGDFLDDVVEGGCGGFDGTGAGGIADGAEADQFGFEHFGGESGDEFAVGQPGASATEHSPLMSEVEAGEGDFLFLDIHPDVHFRPVAEREDAEMFAVVFASVEEIPEFWPLILGVPLAEIVAMAEESLFGAGLFFIATTTAEAAIVSTRLNGIQQGGGLQAVAAGVVALFFAHSAGIDGLLDAGDFEGQAKVGHELIAIVQRFLEIMSSVHMQQRKWHPCGMECLARKPCHDDGILASAEKQGGVLKLRSGLAKHEDGFGFELLKMADVVGGHGG